MEKDLQHKSRSLNLSCLTSLVRLKLRCNTVAASSSQYSRCQRPVWFGAAIDSWKQGHGKAPELIVTRKACTTWHCSESPIASAVGRTQPGRDRPPAPYCAATTRGISLQTLPSSAVGTRLDDSAMHHCESRSGFESRCVHLQIAHIHMWSCRRLIWRPWKIG